MSPPEVPAGTPVAVGHRLVPMPELGEGDRVVAVHSTSELLVIPQADHDLAASAVEAAQAAFGEVAAASDERLTAFFVRCAGLIEDDAAWKQVAEANGRDVARAKESGGQTGRLVASPSMRVAMADGLRRWACSGTVRGRVLDRREGEGWTVERRAVPLGVVAFVFEGRPNVLTDGTGVLRGGNVCVMRVGSAALGTAKALMDAAVRPALAEAGLPEAAVTLLSSRTHAAAQALFTMRRVRLAVARGSGPTVRLLASLAEQHGIPASAHGTGGGWLYVADDAPEPAVRNAIVNSLDRKVCNTLNVLLVSGARHRQAVEALQEARATVHVTQEAAFPGAGVIAPEDLSREWEWDETPEVSLVVVGGDEEAVELVNRHSPRLVAGILTADPVRFERFVQSVDAPFVGNGFTRWVDGQWAWGRPELGLSNWERGRLLGRSGILAGDDVYTVKDVFVDTTREATLRR
ncbi:MAG TPA: aldehyde dehydrogenase family protein [Actinomycetota bacterium]|nr:aldehyde dehydrogenase family protein [Actinomycetota bacterium]